MPQPNITLTDDNPEITSHTQQSKFSCRTPVVALSSSSMPDKLFTAFFFYQKKNVLWVLFVYFRKAIIESMGVATIPLYY